MASCCPGVCEYVKERALPSTLPTYAHRDLLGFLHSLNEEFFKKKKATTKQRKKKKTALITYESYFLPKRKVEFFRSQLCVKSCSVKPMVRLRRKKKKKRFAVLAQSFFGLAPKGIPLPNLIHDKGI